MDLAADLISLWVGLTFPAAPLSELLTCEAAKTGFLSALPLMLLEFTGKRASVSEWRTLQLLQFDIVCSRLRAVGSCFQCNKEKTFMYLAFWSSSFELHLLNFSCKAGNFLTKPL